MPRVIVTTESGGSGLSASEVEVLIGKNPNFVDPSSTHWTCTDGIAGEEALSTPGGDSGEFLMGLALYAAEMKKFYPDYELSKHEVHDMFKEFLGSIDESRSFYMHMDAVHTTHDTHDTHTHTHTQRTTHTHMAHDVF